MTKNQDILSLVIISLILVTGVFDPVVILKGEFRCGSLLELKGFMSDDSGAACGVVHQYTFKAPITETAISNNQILSFVCNA